MLELAANFRRTLSGTTISGGVDDFENVYQYDYLYRLNSLIQQSQSGGHAVAPKLAEFEYNRASQLTDMHRYSAAAASTSDLQVHTRMDYDGAGRLSSLTHGASQIASGQNWDGTSTLPASLGSSGLLAAYTFDYDADNRLTQFSTYRDGTSTAYGYDVRDQLTSAASTAISGLPQPFGLATAESYDFDAGGNRKSSGGASQSAANTHNQLQTDGTYNYTYDDEGNTLSRTVIATGAVTLYEWDHRNRLESITEKTSAVGSVTQKIEYIYDALDQRVGKRLDSDGDGDFDRDEVFLWTEGQTVLRATDSDGEAATETFALASRYLYGDMVDQLLADEQYNGGAGPELSATTASATAGDTYWALTDHLGSVRDLVDNNGVIRQHVAYDSFGNRIVEQDYDASGSTISSSHADAIDELFGYTGRDWDADAGLQNNRARWYDPATGRWLSNDPIGFAAGDANLYRYVGNQPTTLTDPSGLEPPQGSGLPVGPLDGGTTSIHQQLFPEQYPQTPYRPPLSSGTRPERGMIGNGLLAGYLGLSEAGRYLTYPLRWVGVDFSEHDRCQNLLWDDSGVGSESTTRSQAKVGGAMIAVGAGGATAVAGLEAAGAQQMTIIIQATGERIPIHAVYQVGSKSLHASGLQLGRLRVGKASADVMAKAYQSRIFVFQGPVLFPAQAAASGHRAYTCVTAAGNAYFRGWVRWWW